jgi:septal ring factor EnvC (AmiA/AmiB activator)
MGKYTSRLGLLLAAVLAATLLLGPPQAAGQAARGADAAALAKVRKEIEAFEKRLAKQIDERDAGARDLRAAELEVAAASRKLAAARAAVGELERRQAALAREADGAAASLASERAALGEQLRLRYMSGRQEVVKLLLSQESPAALGRMLAYYDYFNMARKARIDVVGAELEKLAELRRQSARAAAELAAVEAEQARELAALGVARDQRKAAVAKIEAGIAGDRGGLERLRAEEKELEALVAELQRILEALPVVSSEPFSELKGKLAWPVAGRLTGEYGKPRAGGLTWAGMLVAAGAGAPVRVISRGRVAFAQWTTAHGLLIMVDHGEGYLSLYAYNESLLKEKDDWVEAGETIAFVGDSGGRSEPGLYFEIRKGTQPVDPRAWVGRTPPP